MRKFKTVINVHKKTKYDLTGQELVDKKTFFKQGGWQEFDVPTESRDIPFAYDPYWQEKGL